MARGKTLSPREQEVLHLLWEGFTTRDIAESLHRSLNTVAMHRKHILEKLGARSTASAFRLALQRDLVEIASAKRVRAFALGSTVSEQEIMPVETLGP
jgi:DNA-binding CsgD family transcriptional regulator